MYRGYNIYTNPSELFDGNDLEYEKIGQDILSSNRRNIEKSLSNYLTNDGKVDGSAIQNDWFPLIKADIFLSHSHKDEKLAIKLAGWLKKYFGLITFIDSCLWGYSKDLINCINCNNLVDIDKQIVDYNKSIYASSHVNMMLAIALQNMMDKTECLFFLNTDNSVYNITNTTVIETISPWIYYELATCKNLRLNTPERLKGNRKRSTFSEEQNLSITEDKDFIYKQSIGNLKEIDTSYLKTWKIFGCNKDFDRNTLDFLYDDNLILQWKQILE